MKRLILAASVVLAVALPAAAQAKAPTPRHVHRYEVLYHRVAKQFGARTPGRNIARWGTRRGPASDAQIVRSSAVLKRMLAPPPPPPAPVAAPSYSPAPAPPAAPVASTSSGGYSIPSYIVQCESSGNYSAVNPSSGAGGAYQILPSTWAAYGGTGSPQSASPAEQNAIAAKIYAADGPSAWSCG